VNLHYIPVYRQPYYARVGFSAAEFPQAERYYGDAISIPMYAGLTDDQQLEVVRRLKTNIA
jgi:dTDP-4-amino-4,6-dideoxygalactose transaminase